MPSKVEEILKDYPTLPRGDRLSAWLQLGELGASYPLTYFEYSLMVKAFDHENDLEPAERVRREPLKTILAFAGPRFQEAATSAGTGVLTKDPKWLNEWFWSPFQFPSLVFWLWHPITRGRDDGALLLLSEHLTRERLPHVFQPVLTSDPSWQRILAAHRVGCLCFVGRLGLYGDEAQRRWGKPRKVLRFGFPGYIRWHGDPKKKKAIDRRFHFLVENVAGQAPVRWRASKNKKTGVRTDYALIQRYTVTEAGKQTFVFCLAGATWVGTQAAAQWVTEILTSPQLDQDRIPLPKDISPDSKLEVLLRVKHDDDYPTWRFASGDIEICKLFLGNSEWNQESRSWRPLSDKLVVILCEDGDPKRPVALEVDGEIKRLDQTKRSAHLLSALYEQTGGHKGAIIDTAQLMKQLPEDETPPDVKTLRKWLAWLQVTHFRGALLIGRQIQLQATFIIRRFEHERPGKRARRVRVRS
jgi:hypothetical protein